MPYTPVIPGASADLSPTENQFIKFISYFRGPILYVMEIAVILAAGLRDWIDFGVIIAIVRDCPQCACKWNIHAL